MKKKILILAGGYSKERDISIKTAKSVYNQIKKDFKCKILDPKKDFIKDSKRKLWYPSTVFILFERYIPLPLPVTLE